MAVETHTCGRPVHLLTDPDGRLRTLDTVDDRFGIWVPNPDGRTCRRATTSEYLRRDGNGHYPGHRLHECPPAEEPTLFDVDSAR